jgi:aspartate-semialdehyde dehydrogenase
VPVLRAHCEAVDLTLARPVSVAQIRQQLEAAAGVVLIDDARRNDFPTALKAAGRDAVLIGRIRLDRSQPWDEQGGEARGVGLHLLLAGDQLRKGAALNALQIAEAVLARAQAGV